MQLLKDQSSRFISRSAKFTPATKLIISGIFQVQDYNSTTVKLSKLTWQTKAGNGWAGESNIYKCNQYVRRHTYLL